MEVKINKVSRRVKAIQLGLGQYFLSGGCLYLRIDCTKAVTELGSIWCIDASKYVVFEDANAIVMAIDPRDIQIMVTVTE